MYFSISIGDLSGISSFSDEEGESGTLFSSAALFVFLMTPYLPGPPTKPPIELIALSLYSSNYLSCNLAISLL